MSRKTARQQVFHLVFALPYAGVLDAQVLARAKAAYFEFLDEGETQEYGLDKLVRPKGSDAAYIDRAYVGVFDRLSELDGVIENFLRDWTIDRLNKVDLALMRLSIYEMLCEKDVPPGVAVNEAVELAKLYGTDDSASFINGVLGNVAREWAKKS
jgi:N utilization substance protein B